MNLERAFSYLIKARIFQAVYNPMQSAIQLRMDRQNTNLYAHVGLDICNPRQCIFQIVLVYIFKILYCCKKEVSITSFRKCI